MWSSSRRLEIQAEIDSALLHIYGLQRDEVLHVLDEFRALRDAEIREVGEFRTKRLILKSYDAMQEAIDTGITFQSTLNPPPGQGPRHPAKEISA